MGDLLCCCESHPSQKTYILSKSIMYSVVWKRTIAIQVETSDKVVVSKKEQGSQCSTHKQGSNNRDSKTEKHLTYHELVNNYLLNKDCLIEWLKKQNLIASSKPVQIAMVQWHGLKRVIDQMLPNGNADNKMLQSDTKLSWV